MTAARCDGCGARLVAPECGRCIAGLRGAAKYVAGHLAAGDTHMVLVQDGAGMLWANEVVALIAYREAGARFVDLRRDDAVEAVWFTFATDPTDPRCAACGWPSLTTAPDDRGRDVCGCCIETREHARDTVANWLVSGARRAVRSDGAWYAIGPTPDPALEAAADATLDLGNAFAVDVIVETIDAERNRKLIEESQ